MYDSFHPYDREVIEFFDTITYLGGKATASFMRGPMNLGDGKGSHKTKEKIINLSGPELQGWLYTRPRGETAPLLKSDNLEVTPCVLENDGMSLKPSIECNSRLKENFELKFKFDLAYVKEHTDPSADDLRNNIITEAIVSSLTTLDKKFSLP